MWAGCGCEGKQRKQQQVLRDVVGYGVVGVQASGVPLLEGEDDRESHVGDGSPAMDGAAVLDGQDEGSQPGVLVSESEVASEVDFVACEDNCVPARSPVRARLVSAAVNFGLTMYVPTHPTHHVAAEWSGVTWSTLCFLV